MDAATKLKYVLNWHRGYADGIDELARSHREMQINDEAAAELAALRAENERQQKGLEVIRRFLPAMSPEIAKQISAVIDASLERKPGG